MGEMGADVRTIGASVPAAVRVRAAVLAVSAGGAGCAPADLEGAVAAHLGVTPGPELRRRVDGAVGLLIVTGWIDEVGGRLVPAAGARAAV